MEKGGNNTKYKEILSGEDQSLHKKKKKSHRKSSSDDDKDQEMEEVQKHKKSSKNKKTKESKHSGIKETKRKEDDMGVESKHKKKKSPAEIPKSRGSKRHSESKHHKLPDSKRKKTEKGEKSICTEKKKSKRVEWQYGRYCPRKLWIGKTAKVKFPALKSSDSPIFRVGKIQNLKADSKGFLNIFEIEFKNKEKSWIDLAENKVYIFGQILYLKYADDGIQSSLIKETYGFNGSRKTPLAVPVIELIDADYKEEGKIKNFDENSEEKVPIQFFNTEKAKKIKQEHLHDLSNSRENEDEIIQKEWKNGKEIVEEMKRYRETYLEWVQINSCIDIDADSSLREYVGKVVRIFKEEKYS